MPYLVLLVVRSRVVHSVGGAMLGVAAVFLIAGQAKPDGVAVVHVTEADVEVTVGGLRYRIEGRVYDPIVCELPPGRHELVVSRNGRDLARESFEMERGESIVLTMWDPARRGEELDPEGSGGPTTGRDHAAR